MKAVITGILNYVTSVVYFFTEEYKTKSYNLHFYWSIPIAFVIVLFALCFMNMNETPFWFHLVVGGFLLYGINFVREWYKGKFKGINADFVDIYFGSYGGIVGAAIASIIYFHVL